MKNALVGYTGFVGGNIYSKGDFEGLFNSRNVNEAYGTNPELLIYSGLRAEKYLANSYPDKDMELIIQAEDNISKINPEKLVLISTIDVFKVPENVDENSKVITDGLQAYGLNRYRLEEWVRERYPEALIIRLPGLFGKGLKKNFIFDFMNVIPSMLKGDKYLELSSIDSRIQKYYVPMDNGFYRVNVPEMDVEMLKDIFRGLGFTALNFTDSRSRYQFYDLTELWKDINIALEHGLKLLHPATEPISAGEVYKYIMGEEFVNILQGMPAVYDYRTIHASIFGGSEGYLYRKQEVLERIKRFIETNSKG